jgi:hypothetical protein
MSSEAGVTPDSSKPAPPSWTFLDVLAFLACGVVGALLAVLPHLVTFARTGSPEYLTDGDDVLYLAISRIAYFGESALRDPFLGYWETAPTLYTWLQFVPLAKVTSWLGLPPILTAIVWRVVGGAALGISLFLVFRRLFASFRSPAIWAVAGSLICLGDGGLINGKVFINNMSLAPYLLKSMTPGGTNNGLPQYRVVTPMLNLPVFLLLLWTLLPGPRKSWKTAVLGGILLALCIHLYFFHWTAAVLGILFWTSIRFVVSLRQGRSSDAWRDFRLGATVLVVGLALGAPQILSNSRTFADPRYKEILVRMVKGVYYPWSDPHRFFYFPNFSTIVPIAVAGVIIVVLRKWKYSVLWWTSFAGYLLSISAIVTGLEFENYHWNYAYGPAKEIVIVGLISELLHRLRAGRSYLVTVGLGIALCAFAVVWRYHDTLYARGPVLYGRILRELEPLRVELEQLKADDVLAGPMEADVALLSTRSARLYEYDQSWISSPIPSEDVDQRFALNSWLQGLDTSEFSRIVRAQSHTSEAHKRLEIEVFQKLLDGAGDRLIERYRPSVLLLPASARAPDRAGPWSQVAGTPRWVLWKRTARKTQQTGLRRSAD